MRCFPRPQWAAAPAGLALLLLTGPSDLDAQTTRHDTSLPIEITADSLEVVQAEQVATFTGNVDAVQGDLVLRADKLHVHYGGEGAGADAGSAGAIRRIEATGNVFLSSPRETARGEVGVYDVATSMITLDGGVVLTREDNVIRGEHLDLNLATGLSRVVGAGTAAAGAQPTERVRAVFTPADEGSGSEGNGSPPGADAEPAGGAGANSPTENETSAPQPPAGG